MRNVDNIKWAKRHEWYGFEYFISVASSLFTAAACFAKGPTLWKRAMLVGSDYRWKDTSADKLAYLFNAKPILKTDQVYINYNLTFSLFVTQMKNLSSELTVDDRLIAKIYLALKQRFHAQKFILITKRVTIKDIAGLLSTPSIEDIANSVVNFEEVDNDIYFYADLLKPTNSTPEGRREGYLSRCWQFWPRRHEDPMSRPLLVADDSDGDYALADSSNSIT